MGRRHLEGEKEARMAAGEAGGEAGVGGVVVVVESMGGGGDHGKRKWTARGSRTEEDW